MYIFIAGQDKVDTIVVYMVLHAHFDSNLSNNGEFIVGESSRALITDVRYFEGCVMIGEGANSIPSDLV